MKLNHKNIIIIILIIGTLSYLTIRLITWPFDNIDFPCGFSFNKQELEPYLISDDFEVKDLVVFISVYPEHTAGGGCYEESVTKNEKLSYNDHEIVLTDTGIYFDKTLIKINDSIILKTSFYKIDLWWIYKNELLIKNNGQFFSFNKYGDIHKLEYPRYFISGVDKTFERINHFTLLIYLGLIVYLIIIIKKMIIKK